MQNQIIGTINIEMFENMTVNELKGLVRDYRKHHNIIKYSKMKKEELITALNNYFILKDGQLYLKPVVKVQPVVINGPSDKQILERYSVNELRSMFTDYGFKGLSKIKKDDLIEQFLNLVTIKNDNVFLKTTNQQINKKPMPKPAGKEEYGANKKARQEMFKKHMESVNNEYKNA
jgi:hypothetical protein